MNPVIIIAHNNLNLTQQAVASVFAQDIPTDLWLVDNGSSDCTEQWMNSLVAPLPHSLHCSFNSENLSPLKIVNDLFRAIFSLGAEYVITMNNDQMLPSNCCRELARWPRGFVSATDIGQTDLPPVRESKPIAECTPFGVILTRKWAYDALIAKDGYFYDDRFFLYASDCDIAVRRVQCGIRGLQIDTPFWHFVSATHRLAPSAEGDKIRSQANRDRAYFRQKYGYGVEELSQGIAADPLNFTDGQPYDIGMVLAK